MSRLIRINPRDNVAVALEPLKSGESALGVTLREDIPAGHKFALCDIAENENVVKYGFPIGHATQPIPAGSWVHTHNVKTNLSGLLEYSYHPHPCAMPVDRKATFEGYVREDGRVGIRNEVWIVNTVGCVNGTAKTLERMAQEAYGDRVDGIHCFVHPYGCSQLGEDHKNTQKLLASMVRHPNAGAVLVLSLGCENNNVNEFKKVLGNYNPNRVKFLITQDVEDEVEAGMRLLDELTAYAATFKRQTVDASELVIGLKCGGSDGLSGITANPSAGYAADMLVKGGATVMFSEVTEVRDGVPMLAARCVSAEVRDKLAAEMKWYDDYLAEGGVDRDANPTPGNKKGGLANIVEKAMGSIAKSGTSPIVEVLSPAEKPSKHGLIFAATPASDIVCGPSQVASGIGLQVFMTGRGTPYGLDVAPVIKVCSRNEMKEQWFDLIDISAGHVATGEATIAEVGTEIFNLILDVASGTKEPYSDQYGFHNDMCIFNPAPIT